MEQDETIILSLDSIIPYENNPRDNDESVPFVANSMEAFGYNSKIEVTEDHIILVGHTRLKALKYLHQQGKLGKGMLEGLSDTHIPVIVKHNLKTKAQQMEYRISDNKTTEKSGWNFPKLDVELIEIEKLDPNFVPEDFGFVSIEFDEPPAEDITEDEPVSEEVIEIADVDKEVKEHRITIFLHDEDEAHELLNRLKEDGYSCKLD